MLKDIAEAMLGRRPFDLVIRNVQIVNVFSASIVSGSIGIVNGHIAGVFGPEEAPEGRRTVDGGSAYALPGFVDSHMHLESSMLIVAENGSVKIGGQYMNEVEYCHIKGYEMPELAPTNPGNDYGPYKGSAQNHNFVIRNVVNVLSGAPGEIITTNVLEGMKVVDIIRRIYAGKSVK